MRRSVVRSVHTSRHRVNLRVQPCSQTQPLRNHPQDRTFGAFRMLLKVLTPPVAESNVCFNVVQLTP